MNTSLPISIETYLKEAGFSQTEMLILRKLLEEDSLTIRELGTKMGKSPGLVDQAMKKLIRKSIVKKETVNGQPKYLINSLDAVVQWVKSDMQGRKVLLEKRQENFETFIATLKVDKKRPDMQHFSGLEGIKQAYDKIIAGGGEVLTFTPVFYLAEDDPLRAYRVDLFRRRQVRKIFQRVLAVDSPLARRFQSKDPFEYRRTLLIPEQELPLTFEKTIVGDTVAYIDLKGENACFLKYPDLAKAERATFDALWLRTLSAEQNGTGTVSASVKMHEVPLSTRISSSLRQYFLGRSSLIALLLFAVLSGIITFGLYTTNRDLNLQRIREKVQAVAITGSLQFDATDINAIWDRADINKPEYAKLIATLNLIRRSNENVQNAYIMRATNDQWKWQFVADADSLDPTAKKDLNNDGKIDSADRLSYPSDTYDIHPYPWSLDAFKKPIVDPQPISDEWGTFITSTAPIKDDAGKSVAVLGIDMFAANLDRFSADSFTPVYAFFTFFLLFMLIRFWLENRSLMEECLVVIRRNIKKTVVLVTFLIILVSGILFAFKRYKYDVFIEQTGERLQAIAVTAANEFDPADVQKLHWARDMKTDAYQRVFQKLNEIRNRNPDITYLFLMRPTKEPLVYEWVADADANWNLPHYTKSFLGDFGPMTDADENTPPGIANYHPDNGIYDEGMQKPVHRYTGLDQWGGGYVTSVVPIYDAQGHAIAVFSLNIDLSRVKY